MSWSKGALQKKGNPAAKWLAPTVDEARQTFAIQQAGDAADMVCPRVRKEEEQRTQDQAVQLGYHHGLQQGRRDGYKDGHQEGIENGYAEGQQLARQEADAYLAEQRALIDEERRAAVADVKKGAEQLADSVHEAVRQWRQEAVQAHALLALEIAHRAIGRELKMTRESVLEIARSAMDELHQGAEFRLLVNPIDVGFLEEHRQDITEVLTHVRGLEVVADRSIIGGCIVESHGGTIDARIEAYLMRMAEHALREEAA